MVTGAWTLVTSVWEKNQPSTPAEKFHDSSFMNLFRLRKALVPSDLLYTVRVCPVPLCTLAHIYIYIHCIWGGGTSAVFLL